MRGSLALSRIYYCNALPSFRNSGQWKTEEFKQYNFNAVGIQPQGGHLHPLMKVREEFRQIFFEMGYGLRML